MTVRHHHSRGPIRCARVVSGVLLLVLLTVALLAVAACGQGGEPSGEAEFQFQQISPSDRTYALEDFLAVGFKKQKQYDVTGLPGGIDAYLGFFGPDPYSRKQYELRFYASHEDAVEQGIALAEEVTGEDAAEYRLNPTWEEGARERWTTGGHSGATTSIMPSGPSPKYGDYAVVGNVLMLCEGARLGQALERCEALFDALTGTAGE